jgi:hypothetical protein
MIGRENDSIRISKVSTSVLAKNLGLSPSEAFSCLNEEGYLKQVGNDRIITQKGFSNGAKYRKSLKYGTFAVWPESWTEEADRIGIYCCGCSKITKPSLVDGKRIYPTQKHLHFKKIWFCSQCENHVGCYDGGLRGTRPLGCIGTPEIRKKRKLIHSKLDPIWQSGKMERKELYETISYELGYGWDFHTGHIRSLPIADQVYDLVMEIADNHSTS